MASFSDMDPGRGAEVVHESGTSSDHNGAYIRQGVEFGRALEYGRILPDVGAIEMFWGWHLDAIGLWA